MASKPTLLVEVYTDPMCPWCPIGHARLLESLTDDWFRAEVLPYMQPVVRLQPYLLDTRLPATDYDPPSRFYDEPDRNGFEPRKPPSKKKYYSDKFGAGLDAFDAKINRAAAEVGVPTYDWSSDSGRASATWLAHRLLLKAWHVGEAQANADASPPNALRFQDVGADGAKPEGSVSTSTSGGKHYTECLQSRLVHALYHAYHHDNLDLGHIPTLARLCTDEKHRVFADEAEAEAWMRGDEYVDELEREVMVGQNNGVQSVPFIVVQEGSDHLSEVGSLQQFQRMWEMAVALHK